VQNKKEMDFLGKAIFPSDYFCDWGVGTGFALEDSVQMERGAAGCVRPEKGTGSTPGGEALKRCVFPADMGHFF
jgi:hypothetical protein